LPDLPGLESVRTTDFGAAPIVLFQGAFALWMAALVVWGLCRFRQFMGAGHVAVAVIVIALAAWLVLRLLFGIYRCESSGAGLALRSPIRKRFIAWTEIAGLSIRTSRTANTVVTLAVQGGSVKLVPRGLGGSMAAGATITASIWQHLRQIGRADGVALHEAVLRLWKPVPQDVPVEVDWHKPPHRHARLGRGLTAAFFLGMAAVPWFAFPPRHIVPAAFVAILSLGILAVFRMARSEQVLRAWRVSVGEGWLDAENASGTIHIPWSEVTSADWLRTYLRIRADGPRREVWVPFATGNGESENLVLAVVRQLRERAEVAIAPPVCVSREPAATPKR